MLSGDAGANAYDHTIPETRSSARSGIVKDSVLVCIRSAIAKVY